MFKPTANEPALPATAQREAKCGDCKGTITKDDNCLWIQNHGIFHVDCVEGGQEIISTQAAEVAKGG